MLFNSKKWFNTLRMNYCYGDVYTPVYVIIGQRRFSDPQLL